MWATKHLKDPNRLPILWEPSGKDTFSISKLVPAAAAITFSD